MNEMNIREEEKNLYEQLRAMLDTHPSGCPAADEIYEILAILFTPGEARAALGLGFVPFDLKTISERSGVPEDEARIHLEALADKGLVFARKKGDAVQYSILPVMPGLFEFPFMKGDMTDDLKHLAGLWKKYLVKLTKGFGTPGMAFSRVVPVRRTIESVSGVLPYESVEELIDNARTCALAHCACRETEGNCDAPREACMMFDETADFLVERGFARYLSREEMKQKLIEFDELGLVHQVNNAQSKVTFICNCCKCCCGLLKSRFDYNNPNVFNFSSFVAQSDRDACTQCGICAEERCRFEAIEMTDDGPAVDETKCIGCGLCATGCPADAMKLVRREKVTWQVAKTNKDMGVAILMEKGRLQDFLPYADPNARPLKK